MTEPAPPSDEHPAPPATLGRMMGVLKRSRKLSTGFVAVLAILIGVPTFVVLLQVCYDFVGARVKGPPYRAAMKSDLRNLVTAQESYFADYVSYTRAFTVDSMRSGYDDSWVPWPSTGVTVTIGVATDRGWSATARHADLGSMVCGIFVGDAPPPIAGAREGEPMCEKRSRD